MFPNEWSVIMINKVTQHSERKQEYSQIESSFLGGQGGGGGLGWVGVEGKGIGLSERGSLLI